MVKVPGSSTLASVGDATRDIRGTLAEAGTAVREVLDDRIEDLIEAATGFGRDARRRASAAKDDIEEFAVEEPVKVMLIAAVVGVLFGWLIRSSSRR